MSHKQILIKVALSQGIVQKVVKNRILKNIDLNKKTFTQLKSMLKNKIYGKAVRKGLGDAITQGASANWYGILR